MLQDVNNLNKGLLDNDGRSDKRATRRRRLVIGFLIVLFFDLLSTILIWFGGIKNFDLSKNPFDFTNVSIQVSDLFLVDIVRILLCLPCRFFFTWWLCVSSVTLVLGKFVLFQGYDDSMPYRVLFLCTSILFSIAELHISKKVCDIDSNKSSAGSVASEEDPRSRFYDGGNGSKKTLSFLQLMKVMRPYFWPNGFGNKCRVVVTFVATGGAKACNVLAPIYIGLASEEVLNRTFPTTNLVLYATLKFLSVFFRELQRVVYLGVKQQAFGEISTETFTHLHSLSLDWHLRKKMGSVLRIMDRGVSSADSVMNYLVLYLVPSVLECFATFVIFYTKFDSPELAVVTFYSFVIYVVLTVKITMWRKKFRKKTNVHDNEYHDRATDSLINYETVKYFANEKFEIKQFKDAVAKYQTYSVSTTASLSLLNVSQQADIQMTVLAGLCIITSLTLSHTAAGQEVSIGSFVAVNAYMVQLFAPLSFLGTIYGTVIQALVDMRNLGELLVLKPDVRDVKGALPIKIKEATVEFKSVNFSYPAEPTKGLRDVSFVAKAGTSTAIVGTTGAGKTTLTRLLFRFYDVETGQILVSGQNTAHVTQRSLRESIGVVPQDTVLFNNTILNNIKYGDINASMERIEEAAKGAQIYSSIMAMEKKWDTVVGERGLKLSGGEKQRVAIARALLKNPPIVLLDEATSALDSVTEKSVQRALIALGEGRTQIIIAHRLSTIQHCDNIIVLEKGKILEQGNHDYLLSSNAKVGKYKEMWDAQNKSEEEDGE